MFSQILKSKWTYAVIRIVGFLLLGAYLLLANDWRVSILWVLTYAAIVIFVSWLVVALKIAERIPALDRRFLFPTNDHAAPAPLTEDEWALSQVNYLESGARGLTLLGSPSEDGLICVPVLVAGLGLATSIIGGAAFGLLHLGRFTYVECAGKAIYYTLACYFVLPNGILNVVFGHFLLNLCGLAALKVGKHVLSKKAAL